MKLCPTPPPDGASPTTKSAESQRRLVVRSERLRLSAVCWNTRTADLIWQALPIAGEVLRWGHEISLQVALSIELEPEAIQIVAPGSLCFWCEGQSISLPFGPTPISLNAECRLPAPVNLFGEFEGDFGSLAATASGDRLRIERAQP